MTNDFQSYNNLYTPEERKQLFAEGLKAFRKLNKLTQQKIADDIGIKVQTYASYERGRSEPSMEILVRLSLYFDVPLDILLQRDNRNKDLFNAKKQWEEYEAIIQAAADELQKGNPEAQAQFKELIDSLGMLKGLIKDMEEC